MRRDVFVYLSGPMTAKHGRSIEQNVANALPLYFELLRRGVPAFCPHLSGLAPSAWLDVPYEAWLQYDFAVIDRCTHVHMLDNWRESTGALAELKYAEDAGKVVTYTEKELWSVLAVDGRAA